MLPILFSRRLGAVTVTLKSPECFLTNADGERSHVWKCICVLLMITARASLREVATTLQRLKTDATDLDTHVTAWSKLLFLTDI